MLFNPYSVLSRDGIAQSKCYIVTVAQCTTALSALSRNDDLNDELFIIDAGATHHMCSNKSLFRNIENVPKYSVVLGDGSSVESEFVGEIDLFLRVEGASQESDDSV